MGATFADIAAADVGTVFTNPDQFGQIVTHKPRRGSTFDVNGVFTQSALTPLRDDRKGRENENAASLLIGLVDVNGHAFTLDDQGEFMVAGQRWTVTNIANTSGGYLLGLKKPDIKTMRHLPGNG